MIDSVSVPRLFPKHGEHCDGPAPGHASGQREQSTLGPGTTMMMSEATRKVSELSRR
jgi:hypothetical protein